MCYLNIANVFTRGRIDRTSLDELMKDVVGKWNTTYSKVGCSCKKGCGNNCGFKKKGYRCHSGCFCNGNCCAKGL